MPGLVRVTRREWLRLSVAGRAAVLPPPRGPAPLEWLQAAVGGYIEQVRVGPGVVLWVNEEGRLRGLPINRLATAVVASLYHAGHGYQWAGGPIVGDALLEVRS